jgi:hypothetical protein
MEVTLETTTSVTLRHLRLAMLLATSAAMPLKPPTEMAARQRRLMQSLTVHTGTAAFSCRRFRNRHPGQYRVYAIQQKASSPQRSLR